MLSKRFLSFVPREEAPARFASSLTSSFSVNFVSAGTETSPRSRDAPLSQITDEVSGQYARYRMEVCDNEVGSVNGDIRTLRRIMRLLQSGASCCMRPRSSFSTK